VKLQDYSERLGERAILGKMPTHVAIIMDGNGRWARKQGLPRTFGHKKGKETVRLIAEDCLKKGIRYLTLFGFGQENWKRPAGEVRTLFRLFFIALKKDLSQLHDQGVCLKVHGEITAMPLYLQKAIEQACEQTKQNSKMILNLMVNYSGRWDILRAVRLSQGSGLAELEDTFRQNLCLSGMPEPDLFIRPGGVQRLSNFILWDLAYTELYFSNVSWPEFDLNELDNALLHYANQERRFGLTSEQLVDNTC
jgi:undecaprenyl diphosphate synthase